MSYLTHDQPLLLGCVVVLCCVACADVFCVVVVVVPHPSDGSVDPWTKMKQDKKERIDKNKKQRARNLEAAAGPRLPGTIDLTSAVSVAGGDRPGKRNQQGKMKAKSHVDVCLIRSID
jgi:hypothetical protein